MNVLVRILLGAGTALLLYTEVWAVSFAIAFIESAVHHQEAKLGVWAVLPLVIGGVGSIFAGIATAWNMPEDALKRNK